MEASLTQRAPGDWARWLIAVACLLFVLCKTGVLSLVFSVALGFLAERLVELGAGDFLI